MEAKTQSIVVIGETGNGKTTLVNALLRWDILPQVMDDMTHPTEACVTLPLADGFQITDTPGYDSKTRRIDPEVRQAISRADHVVVVLDEETTGIGLYPGELASLRKLHRKRHKAFLKNLFGETGRKRVYFVIPYDTEEWGDDAVPLEQIRRRVSKRLFPISRYGKASCFCIDSLKALIGEIEADEQAIAQSGIQALRAAILEEENENGSIFES